jgi:hypothetical protein
MPASEQKASTKNRALVTGFLWRITSRLETTSITAKPAYRAGVIGVSSG